MIHRVFSPLLVILVLLNIGCTSREEKDTAVKEQPDPFEYALVIHGGAGQMNFENLPEPRQQLYTHALDSALQLGLDILKEGGASIDAVEVVIRSMEDNPLFNAGKGAVFTSEGTNELDASIMTGWDMNAGAVASVTDIKNPITAPRAVMEKSEHVMLAGKGASVFA